MPEYERKEFVRLESEYNEKLEQQMESSKSK